MEKSYQASCIHCEIKYEDTVMSLSAKFSLGIYFHWMAFQNVISQPAEDGAHDRFSPFDITREVVANNKAPSTNKHMRENEIENESKKETEGNKKEMERREYALIRIKVLLLI